MSSMEGSEISKMLTGVYLCLFFFLFSVCFQKKKKKKLFFIAPAKIGPQGHMVFSLAKFGICAPLKPYGLQMVRVVVTQGKSNRSSVWRRRENGYQVKGKTANNPSTSQCHIFLLLSYSIACVYSLSLISSACT